MEIPSIAYTSPNVDQPKPINGASHNRAYDIISKVAYLIGVQKQHFEHDYATPLLTIYEQLNGI